MTSLRVGTSGWSYRSWVGPFYPPGTPTARMLSHYGSQFGGVEAHSTHRRVPGATALQSWVHQVPPDFRFVPKAHANLTHRRDLAGVDERMAAFVADLEPLRPVLGPILFVLPHRQVDLDRLDALLDALPQGPTAPAAVFELAPAWHTTEVRDRLARRGASLAIVDRDDSDGGDPPAPAADEPSGPVAYVRLRRATYRPEDLDRWAGRLEGWAAAGRETYAFVKHDEEGLGPRYASELIGATHGR